MNISIKAAIVASAFLVSTVGAQESTAHDICGALLCMSSPDISSAPHECRQYVEPYFDIRVYKARKFHPARTFNKRRQELDSKCPEAREIDRERVNAKFGSLEHSPFRY